MFTHLHLHTQYSLLEGAIRIKDLIPALKNKGFESCAITDHGNMFGAIEFYNAMKDSKLKPIIGLGAFVLEDESREIKNFDLRKYNYQRHIQLICLNKTGYHNLNYLVSLSYTKGKLGGIPFISKDLLEKYHEGLVVLSGGMQSEINMNFKEGKDEDARQIAIWYRDLFQSRYYIEIQNTGISEQGIINQQLIKLGKELDIPLVGTNNCFYLTPEEAESQHILRLMGL